MRAKSFLESSWSKPILGDSGDARDALRILGNLLVSFTGLFGFPEFVRRGEGFLNSFGMQRKPFRYSLGCSGCSGCSRVGPRRAFGCSSIGKTFCVIQPSEWSGNGEQTRRTKRSKKKKNEEETKEKDGGRITKKKRKKTTTTRRNKRRNRRKNEVHRPRNARLVRCWPVSARIGCIFFILPSFST